MNEEFEIIIVGAGPAGLTAAYTAWQNGAKNILILERDREAGGILQQCIHNGFGLHHFKQELTGPGFAQKCYDLIKSHEEIKLWVDTMVLHIENKSDDEKIVTALNPEKGLVHLKANRIILTMGCRERTRGAIRTPGFRGAGIYTAGAAQRMVNMEGFIPGKKIVILGSGDIGLIMARRMSLEGCQVQVVLEICPFSNGLNRNILQCLKDFDIPLRVSHTITKIHGKDRVTGITVAKVDEKMRVIPNTEFYVECDTILLSVGLIPENELSREMGVELHQRTNGLMVDQHRETNLKGVYAAGNVVHVHDLVDFVADEAEIAGKFAALSLQTKEDYPRTIQVTPGNGVNTCVPQRLHLKADGNDEPIRLFMRVSQPKRNIKLCIESGDEQILLRPMPVAKPSEMISVDLPKNKIANVTQDITVRIIE